eukprot:scaffold50_cov420-Prasinococcus_capsulatus_cf.AAC.34
MCGDGPSHRRRAGRPALPALVGVRSACEGQPRLACNALSTRAEVRAAAGLSSLPSCALARPKCGQQSFVGPTTYRTVQGHV